MSVVVAEVLQVVEVAVDHPTRWQLLHELPVGEVAVASSESMPKQRPTEQLPRHRRRVLRDPLRTGGTQLGGRLLEPRNAVSVSKGGQLVPFDPAPWPEPSDVRVDQLSRCILQDPGHGEREAAWKVQERIEDHLGVGVRDVEKCQSISSVGRSCVGQTPLQRWLRQPPIEVGPVVDLSGERDERAPLHQRPNSVLRLRLVERQQEGGRSVGSPVVQLRHLLQYAFEDCASVER